MNIGQIELRIENVSKDELLHYQEIIYALITCGGLSGVKNGKTIIHFDSEGQFRGIELDYWPWKRRKPAPVVRVS